MNIDLEDFWNTCELDFAHIERDINDLFKQWEERFIPWFDFKGKCVVDYGIGGGWLGVLLGNKYGIDKYVGVDIAGRSLTEALANMRRLSPQTRTHFLYSEPPTYADLRPDIFISQACIQHFTDRDYFEDFFAYLNASEIPEVMVQIRQGDKLEFDRNSVRFGCRTTVVDVNERLPAYALTHASEMFEDTGYRFLHYVHR